MTSVRPNGEIDITAGAPIDQDESPDKGKLWCHTAGRVESAVKAPIYTLAALFQLPKMGVKLAFSGLQLLFNGFYNLGISLYNGYALLADKIPKDYEYLVIDHSWSFSGLAKDGIATLNLSQRATNSVWLTLVAPPPKYRPVEKALEVSFSTVFLGSYHSTQTASKVVDAWEIFSCLIPNYLKQISSCLRNEDTFFTKHQSG